MCLAVPGKIVEIKDVGDTPTGPVAVVDFNGSTVEVSLAVVPEAKQGDYVLVHAGYALETLDETEAKKTWQYLNEAGIDFKGAGLEFEWKDE